MYLPTHSLLVHFWCHLLYGPHHHNTVSAWVIVALISGYAQPLQFSTL